MQFLAKILFWKFIPNFNPPMGGGLEDNISVKIWTLHSILNRATLYSLSDKVRSDLRYKVLRHRTFNNIRKFKLPRRGCKGGKRRRSHLDIIHQTGSNKNNLIRIKTEQQEVRSNYHSVCICLANIQSVKNK